MALASYVERRASAGKQRVTLGRHSSGFHMHGQSVQRHDMGSATIGVLVILHKFNQIAALVLFIGFLFIISLVHWFSGSWVHEFMSLWVYDDSMMVYPLSYWERNVTVTQLCSWRNTIHDSSVHRFIHCFFTRACRTLLGDEPQPQSIARTPSDLGHEWWWQEFNRFNQCVVEKSL